MADLAIGEAHDASARAAAFAIRRAVFIDEQQISEALEFDGLDEDAVHLVARLDGQTLGALRLRFLDDGHAKIERVAVLEQARGSRIGQRMVDAALRLASDHRAREALLHAQVSVCRFYERLGFMSVGETFVEDGILHIAMRRPLGGGPREAAA